MRPTQVRGGAEALTIPSLSLTAAQALDSLSDYTLCAA